MAAASPFLAAVPSMALPVRPAAVGQMASARQALTPRPGEEHRGGPLLLSGVPMAAQSLAPMVRQRSVPRGDASSAGGVVVPRTGAGIASRETQWQAADRSVATAASVTRGTAQLSGPGTVRQTAPTSGVATPLLAANAVRGTLASPNLPPPTGGFASTGTGAGSRARAESAGGFAPAQAGSESGRSPEGGRATSVGGLASGASRGESGRGLVASATSQSVGPAGAARSPDGGTGGPSAAAAGSSERSYGGLSASGAAVRVALAGRGGGGTASAFVPGRVTREAVTGGGTLLAAALPGGRTATPDTSSGGARLTGTATGPGVGAAGRETVQSRLAASGGVAVAYAVEERYAATPLKVESPKSVCELPLIAAGFDRRPIPKGLDNISASAAALDVEEAPRYHPQNIQPVYPLAGLMRSLAGRVVVRAEVSPDGRVGRSWIKTGSGERILDDAALATVRAWAFFPARRNGEAVTAWVDVPIEYRSPLLRAAY